MRQTEPAFAHHFDEVSKAEFVAEIPADTEDDDFPVEMAAFGKVRPFSVRSLALSFDQFAGDYAVFTPFAPEPAAAL
jgi:hypothetical protein